MASIPSTIALKVLGNLATDLVRRAAGHRSEPLEEAIQSTAAAFPELEGVADTFCEWLKSTQVLEILERYATGELGTNDLPIDELVTDLIDHAGFYVGQHSRPTAEKVLSTFFSKLRNAYLVSPAGTLHIANRQEAGFARGEQLIEQLRATVESSGGLKPALQTHFDQAQARLERSEFSTAQPLFESLLVELAKSPIREPHLERRCHASLGQICASLGENECAAMHYRKAVELDENLVRATVNDAVADLIDGKPETALDKLNKVSCASSDPAAFEFAAARVSALLQLKRYPEALEAAREIKVAGKEARQFELLGTVFRESGDIDSAEKAFRSGLELEPTRPELQFSVAETMFFPITQFRNQRPGAPLDAEQKSRLLQSSELLTATAATFRKQGRSRATSQATSALAVVRLLQDRPQDTISLLEGSPENSPGDLRTLGFAYVFTNQSEKALEAFRKSLASDPDPTIEILTAHTLIMAGRAEEALELALEKTRDLIDAENLTWHIIKARALVAQRQFSKASETISSLRQFSTDPDVSLTLAELNETIGNDEAAIEAYEEALKNAVGGTEVRVRFAFGGFSASRKNFARAVELWKPLVDYGRCDQLLENYARVLYNSRNLAELTQIANQLKTTQTAVWAGVAEVLAAAYQRLDDLQEAAYWLEYLCNKYGNKPNFIIQLANIRLRQGNKEAALELLEATKSTLKEARELIGYAQAYSMLGKHRDALELATRAARMVQDPEIHMLAIGAFLAAPDNIERTPEEIATHQDILAKFKERFPDSTQLQSFSVDPERPLDAIRETLEKHSRRAQEVLATYRENLLPLQVFANLLGKDLYETWLALISTPNLPLRSGLATDEEARESLRKLSTATGFIVDPIAMFTFCFLGLTGELSNIGDVYVAQRILDYLHELTAKRSISGSGVIGIIDGEFFMQEITPEEHERRNAALSCAVRWAETGRAIGLKEPVTTEEEKWEELLGSESVSMMVIARQRSLVLITDDQALAQIARQDYGVSTVNTQAVLSYLERRKSLSKESYDNAMTKMLEAGYTTRVDEVLIYRVMTSEQFQLTQRVKNVLAILESPSAPTGSVCAIAAGLIRMIFLEPIPDEMRSSLLWGILETITKNRPKLEVQGLLRAFLHQRMKPLLALQLQKIEEFLNRW